MGDHTHQKVREKQIRYLPFYRSRRKVMSVSIKTPQCYKNINYQKGIILKSNRSLTNRLTNHKRQFQVQVR